MPLNIFLLSAFAARVRSVVASHSSRTLTAEVAPNRFLEEARRTLPRRLYTQVKRAYEPGMMPPQLQFVFLGDTHTEAGR